MKIIQKAIGLQGRDYYEAHLGIINNFLPYKMTPTHIKVLASFLNLDENITVDSMFNPLARKKVKEDLDNMSASALSNHLGALIKMGYLKKNEITGKITIVDFILPEEYIQFYQFKLNKT